MRYQKSVRVTYQIKNSDGFIVEHREKFSTMQDAISFLSLIKSHKLIGKPILETK